MTATVDTLFQEALQLSEESRLALVERLIVSSDSYTSIEREQVKIAESRLEKLRTGVVQGVSVEGALERAREAARNRSKT